MRSRSLCLVLLPLAACASTPSHVPADAHLALVDAEPPAEPAIVAEPAPAAPAEAAHAAASATPDPAFAEPVLPSVGSLDAPPQRNEGPSTQPVWHKGQGLAQGWLGVTSITGSERTGSSIPGSSSGEADIGNFPVIGGGGQWKFAGEGIDFGLEGGINFAFETDGGFFATGSNGATVAVSIDTLLFDLYGGAFLSKYLGDKLRIYGAAGPLMQWASWDQDSSDAVFNGSGSGFGFGYYLRAGLEFVVGHGTMVGFSGRWFDTQVDLSDGLGDLDLDGAQVLFTVTRSF